MTPAALQADKTVDSSGDLCPTPILKLSKGIKEIQVGEVLKMIATDPGSQADMPAWARQTGNELLDAHLEDDKFVFYFRRTR
jgi:tRNA 2-thiouridine synthesizing protein A